MIMTMQGDAYLKCIDANCGLEYDVKNTNVQCKKGHMLDVKYKNRPTEKLKEVFYQRRNPQNSIFNESGVWRFRELFNFCQIDAENIEECSNHLVSLDGAEGRQSKPYQMSKATEFTGMESGNMWLQPEGYNPSGSFKDNGMATAVTHAKMVSAKKIICASTGNTEAPDWMVYPGGALGNTSSCGKALMELHEWGWIKKIPRIAVINSDGASTLSDLYNGKFEGEELRWNKGNPNTGLVSRYYDHLDKEGLRPKTNATAIQIGRPANILKGLRALEFTNGVATTVSDSEMLDGMSVVGLNGFDCEMASGASVAGIKKLTSEEIIKKDDVVVGILTGRQKDAMIPVDYHDDPTNKFAKPPKC